MHPTLARLAPSSCPGIGEDACYLALQTRDARFDGRFFTGVTSTGIYCRPVCKVRLPRRENCRFFSHAAQAEAQGFRPCLRCRPELAPGGQPWSLHDASSLLAQHAARLMEDTGTWEQCPPSVAGLARRLGITDRHLRRIFEAEFGVSPLQYLQTRRLLLAKLLLTDTPLPVTQVASLSGFGSVRRFNAAFAAQYGLNPTGLRGTASACSRLANQPLSLRLGLRPPYDHAAMAAFFARRQLDSVEVVSTGDAGLWRYGRTWCVELQGQALEGWLMASVEPLQHQVHLQVSEGLIPVLPLVVRRVRALLDLDADPAAIQAVLATDFPGGEGLRVPGSVDGFELAVRAVLGQQITVAAARTLTQRLVDRFGRLVTTPYPALSRLFPGAGVLAQAEGDALGSLGIVRQRQAAIVALARAVVQGQLALHPGADLAATLQALKALPGIGDWTAQYIAMRALRWPDAFVAGDVALHKALGLQGHSHPAREAEALSQAWRPWRSYAVLRAWQGLARPPVSP